MATSVPMSQQTTLHANDADELQGVLRAQYDIENAPDVDTASGFLGGARATKSTQCVAADGLRKYPGRGTREDPYAVDWDLGDVENPYNWTKRRKWAITAQLATTVFTVSFCSSCYSGGLESMSAELHLSTTVSILGVSLYVLGFGLGPLLFAPLGELYGRRIVFVVTSLLFTVFHLGGALGHDGTTIIVTRLFAGIFGAAPLTNAGGALSDMWNARERGTASAIYGVAPWMGPVVGPIVGGWISETRLGWRFSFWIMFIISALNALACIFVTPETFGPELLRRRARKLTKESDGRVIYVSRFDLTRPTNMRDVFKVTMGRPFFFLFTEPIVLLLSIYISIAYATLYAFFAAFPIVFQHHRGFSPGEGGLAFLGIGLGNVLGMGMAPIQNRLYWAAMDRNGGKPIPEGRLYLPMVGGVVLPFSLFWFAWTSDPPVPWIVPILAGIPFGFSVAVLMMGLTQYLMDAYSIYCASAIASTVVMRSVVAFAFPLFSPSMYANLGDAWACSVFAFLSTACMPVMFLFFRYGSWIRSKSKFTQHADDVSARSLAKAVEPPSPPAEEDEKKLEAVSEEKGVLEQ